jgi:hypothetical protein
MIMAIVKERARRSPRLHRRMRRHVCVGVGGSAGHAGISKH